MWQVLAVLALVASLSPAPQSSPLSDRDWTRWLNDVGPLLTATEKKDAKKTAPEARERFRDAFWAGRDPGGQDGDNPQRVEFEQRVREAEARYRDGPNGPWNDCGRAFVVIGTPDRIVSRVGAGRTASTDPLQASREMDDIEAEAWFYRDPGRLPRTPLGYDFKFTTKCQALEAAGFERLLQRAAGSYVLAR